MACHAIGTTKQARYQRRPELVYIRPAKWLKSTNNDDADVDNNNNNNGDNDNNVAREQVSLFKLIIELLI